MPEDETRRVEMLARAGRRAERSERALAFAPRIGERPKKTTTNVAKVAAADAKRKRRRLRRMNQISVVHFD